MERHLGISPAFSLECERAPHDTNIALKTGAGPNFAFRLLIWTTSVPSLHLTRIKINKIGRTPDYLQVSQYVMLFVHNPQD